MKMTDEALVWEIKRLWNHPAELLRLAEKIEPPQWNRAFFYVLKEAA